MSDEQLRMQAVVVDHATGPLQKSARQIQTVGGQRMDRLEGQMTRAERAIKPVAREVLNTVSGGTGGGPLLQNAALGGGGLPATARNFRMGGFRGGSISVGGNAGGSRPSLEEAARAPDGAKLDNPLMKQPAGETIRGKNKSHTAMTAVMDQLRREGFQGNEPRGTNVSAQGGGLFKQVELQRSMQMTPADQGPLERMPIGY